MEINEVVFFLFFFLCKFNFLLEVFFIYELIIMMFVVMFKVYCFLCLKIIWCKLFLCYYIKYNKIVLYLVL